MHGSIRGESPIPEKQPNLELVESFSKPIHNRNVSLQHGNIQKVVVSSSYLPDIDNAHSDNDHSHHSSVLDMDDASVHDIHNPSLLVNDYNYGNSNNYNYHSDKEDDIDHNNNNNYNNNQNDHDHEKSVVIHGSDITNLNALDLITTNKSKSLIEDAVMDDIIGHMQTKR